jgi:hypothetical protein
MSADIDALRIKHPASGISTGGDIVASDFGSFIWGNGRIILWGWSKGVKSFVDSCQSPLRDFRRCDADWAGQNVGLLNAENFARFYLGDAALLMMQQRMCEFGSAGSGETICTVFSDRRHLAERN